MNTRVQKFLLGSFSWKRVLRSIVIIYVIFVVAAHFLSDFLIFRPQPASYSATSSLIKIAKGSDTIVARYLKNPMADFVVLYSHGNAEDLGFIEEYQNIYHGKGYAVFAYDYFGYGLSSGSPSEKSTYRSAELAYEYIVDVLKIPPQRIVLHGQSVGGGPATYLAEKYDVAGLVLESSFVSAYRALTGWPIFPFDKFENLKSIEKIDCPLLVIHGTEDRTIDDWNGKKLYERALDPKMYVPLIGANHNMIPYDAQEVYWDELKNFTSLLIPLQ